MIHKEEDLVRTAALWDLRGVKGNNDHCFSLLYPSNVML